MRYMAFEALNGRHMFTQGSKKIKLADTYFVQNPLHDLESTLWMALEFAMCYVPRRLLPANFSEDLSSTLVLLYVGSGLGLFCRRRCAGRSPGLDFGRGGGSISPLALMSFP